MAAAGEVSAAYGALEDEIAGEAEVLGGAVEDDVAWSVAGGVTDGDEVIAEEQGLAVEEIDGGLGAGVDGEAVFCAAAADLPQVVIGWVEGDQGEGVEGIGDGRGAADVIKMGVGVPEVGDAPSAGLGGGEDLRAIPGGVDDGGDLEDGVGEEVGVGLHRPLDESEDF